MIIKLLIDGGNMKPGPTIAQQLGPMGINIGKVISEVNSATKNFAGMQVPVNLDINPQTKEFKAVVLSPPVSALLKKEAGTEVASGERKKMQCGNLAIEQIIAVTKQKYPNMLARDFKKALLSVLGSAMTLGLLIESKDPKEIIEDVKKGSYDNLIRDEKTDASAEKLKELKDFFGQVKAKQEAVKKMEEEAKAAEEAKKAEAAVAVKPAEAESPQKTAPVKVAPPKK